MATTFSYVHQDQSLCSDKLITKMQKVNFFLCLITRHAMMTHGWVTVYLHAFLTSALDRCEWSASGASRFIRRERTPGTNWIGGFVGPRAGLHVVANRKVPSKHLPRIAPRSSIP